MADETTTIEPEARTVMYQVRDKDGNTVGEFSTPDGADFKWPAAKKGETRWVKRGERWQQAK